MATDISVRVDGAQPATPALRRRTIALGVVTSLLIAVALVARTRPTVPAADPAGWTRCTNDSEGFSVAYPKAWYSWGPGAQTCSLFDEAPIEGSPVFLPNWDIVPGRHPTTALQVVPYDGSFGYTVGTITKDPVYERVLSQRSTRIAGRRAVAIETIATGLGFYERDARAYWYVIDVDGTGFVVSTVAQGLRAPRYAEFKTVVDRAAKSLFFVAPGHGTHHRREFAFGALATFVLAGTCVVLLRRSCRRRGDRRGPRPAAAG